MLYPLFWLIEELLTLYKYAIIAAVIFSLLINFGVINARSQFVYTVVDFLNRVTEPFLSRIRRFLPDFGSIDISPVIAILLIQVLQMLIANLYGRAVLGGVSF